MLSGIHIFIEKLCVPYSNIGWLLSRQLHSWHLEMSNFSFLRFHGSCVCPSFLSVKEEIIMTLVNNKKIFTQEYCIRYQNYNKRGQSWAQLQIE